MPTLTIRGRFEFPIPQVRERWLPSVRKEKKVGLLQIFPHPILREAVTFSIWSSGEIGCTELNIGRGTHG